MTTLTLCPNLITIKSSPKPLSHLHTLKAGRVVYKPNRCIPLFAGLKVQPVLTMRGGYYKQSGIGWDGACIFGLHNYFLHRHGRIHADVEGYWFGAEFFMAEHYFVVYHYRYAVVIYKPVIVKIKPYVARVYCYLLYAFKRRRLHPRKGNVPRLACCACVDYLARPVATQYFAIGSSIPKVVYFYAGGAILRYVKGQNILFPDSDAFGLLVVLAFKILFYIIAGIRIVVTNPGYLLALYIDLQFEVVFREAAARRLGEGTFPDAVEHLCGQRPCQQATKQNNKSNLFYHPGNVREIGLQCSGNYMNGGGRKLTEDR